MRGGKTGMCKEQVMERGGEIRDLKESWRGKGRKSEERFYQTGFTPNPSPASKPVRSMLFQSWLVFECDSHFLVRFAK